MRLAVRQVAKDKLQITDWRFAFVADAESAIRKTK